MHDRRWRAVRALDCGALVSRTSGVGGHAHTPTCPRMPRCAAPRPHTSGAVVRAIPLPSAHPPARRLPSPRTCMSGAVVRAIPLPSAHPPARRLPSPRTCMSGAVVRAIPLPSAHPPARRLPSPRTCMSGAVVRAIPLPSAHPPARRLPSPRTCMSGAVVRAPDCQALPRLTADSSAAKSSWGSTSVTFCSCTCGGTWFRLRDRQAGRQAARAAKETQ